MNLSLYIHKYYSLKLFLICILLCAAVGCIPAILIPVEGNLVDEAIRGILQGAQVSFFLQLFFYLILLFCQSVFASFLLRNTELHKIITSRRLDVERLEKANRIAFSVTETQQFHELFEKAGKAPELDSTCYKALQDIVAGSVQLIASLAVMLAIDVWTVISLVLLLCAGIAININHARKTEGFWGKYIENMRRANYFSVLLTQREYAAERKLFDYSGEIGRRFEKEFAGARKENDHLGRDRFHTEVVVTLFTVSYSLAAFLLLLRPLSTGMITIGTFTAAFYAAEKLRKTSCQILDSVFSFSGSYRQLSGFFSFLDLEEEDTGTSIQTPEMDLGIEFRHVSFTYPDSDMPVLQDLNFTLHSGGHYALVGENGCGKTTLVKLLLGLYQPTAGEILVGGKSTGDMTVEDKRRLFCAVFQDFYRYPLSVRENVSLGRNESLEDKNIASVFDLIDFHPSILNQKDGMDRNLMYIKEDGVSLSGGEWQKLTIARCTLSDAPVVVLDEPNAALDPISEENIYAAYRKLLSQKTTLFISHRLGSVKSSSQILVLLNGHLVAMGTHEHLMQDCEYYAKLFETQRRLYYEA